MQGDSSQIGQVDVIRVVEEVAAAVKKTERVVHQHHQLLQDEAAKSKVQKLPLYNLASRMPNTQGALKKLHSMLHKMHELSIRDELTGLCNRRFFSEQA